jgi:hypothetical protein
MDFPLLRDYADSNPLAPVVVQPARHGTKFSTQAKALFRKNAVQQKRAWKTNIAVIATPLFFCLLLLILQVGRSRPLDGTQLPSEGCSTAQKHWG